MITLRQVLSELEHISGPVSLAELAHKLDLDPGVLEDMIGFWVRKGKLRSVGHLPACDLCDEKAGCPHGVDLPRRYELVRGENVTFQLEPPCTYCR